MSELVENIAGLLRRSGIDEFAIGANFNELVPQDVITTYDDEWQKIYFEGEMMFRDPVCWAGAFSNNPIWWKDIQSRNSVMREARQFGIYGAKKPGLVIPVYSGGEKVVISAVSQSFDDITVEEINDLVIGVSDSMFQRFSPSQIPLSAQQKAMLWLKSEGFSYVEISRILRVKVWTVNDGLDRARNALAARDTVQAVSVAIRRQIIS
ncbi:helix-turn-helix transcriptional regulator [Lentilitoribacter sp. EG35]|uniref:helix-turn-helix transcriptional regulator n=1 Tax=Lentilitoribacter sp. EG35 TaxID=3234192 RepID=UPI00345F5DDB